MYEAKKYEYNVTKEMKEQAALEKRIEEEKIAKSANECTAKIKQWKIRARSISDHNKLMKLNERKERYEQDKFEVIRRRAPFEKRLLEASDMEDRMMCKLQNTMQQQRKALNELEAQLDKNKQ